MSNFRLHAATVYMHKPVSQFFFACNEFICREWKHSALYTCVHDFKNSRACLRMPDVGVLSIVLLLYRCQYIPKRGIIISSLYRTSQLEIPILSHLTSIPLLWICWSLIKEECAINCSLTSMAQNLSTCRNKDLCRVWLNSLRRKSNTLQKKRTKMQNKFSGMQISFWCALIPEVCWRMN